MIRRTSTKLAATVVAASILAAAPARAQGGDAALALSLFEEGRKLAGEGSYEAACPKFLASYNQVQKLGTLLNLADCYEKQGKTASAWARFTEAQGMAERAGQPERVEFARSHAEALAPKLARLTITVAAQTPGIGIEVKRDGATVDPAAFGTAVPVDPGKHVVEARASGKKAWSTSVDVSGDGGKAAVEVPPLEAEVAAPPPKTAEPPPGPGPVAPAPEDRSSSGSAQRTWGIVAGAVGLAGIGAGLVFGKVAGDQYEKSNPYCVGDVCTREGLTNREDAQGIAGVATGVFIAGAVLLAGGVTLYLTAPSGKSAAKTSVNVGPGSIAIGRTW